MGLSLVLLLDDITAEMLTEVVRKHQTKTARGICGPGKVIADTTFGIWVHLLGRGGHSALGRAIDYETKLWRPAVRFGARVRFVGNKPDGVRLHRLYDVVVSH